MADLSVSGRLWDGAQLKDGVLHIDTATGTIEKVVKSQKLKEHRDFGSMAILPGAIDIHVHFRDPGATHKEDITSGSTAAAYGGVTAFIDMPNTLPPTTTVRSLAQKLETMAKKSVVDYGAWAGATWYTGEVDALLDKAVGMKVYLGSTTGDLMMDDREAMVEVLKRCAAKGRPLILHCEAQRILDRMRRTEASAADHDQARPPVAEVEAIYDVMKAVAGLRPAPRIHIAHASSREAAQAARTAKFSVGVCPHHLLLDTGADRGHGYMKVNPPLRSAAQREAMWKGWADGDIPIVESDHAPHTRTEKEGAFHNAPAGLPGVETMVPMLLACAVRGKVAMQRVVDSTSRAPAALLGLEDRGSLQAGMKADFAVYDLDAVTHVDGGKLHSRCGWSPYEGAEAVFPAHTWVRGKPVVEAGQLVAGPGAGSPIRP